MRGLIRLNRCNPDPVDTSRLAAEPSPGYSTENKTRKSSPTRTRDITDLVITYAKLAAIAPAASETHRGSRCAATTGTRPP